MSEDVKTKTIGLLLRAIATVLGKRDEFDAHMARMEHFTPEQIAAEARDAARRFAEQDRARSCTCHPDDNPPVPCAKKYAASECLASHPPPTPEDR